MFQGGPPGLERYRIRQNLLSIGDDYWIENARGQKLFKVNGKALTLVNTLDIEDRMGRCLVKIQGKVLSITPAMDIFDARGQKIATVHKSLINLVSDSWKVDCPGVGQDLVVRGNLLDHEYNVFRQNRKVAEISKKFFTLSDSYGIEIMPNENDALIIAVAVCVDQMAHPDSTTGVAHGTTADLGVLTPGQGGGPISVNNSNVALGGLGQAMVAPPPQQVVRPPVPNVAPVVVGAAVAGSMMQQPGYAAPPPQGYPPQGYAAPPQGYAAPPQGYAPPPQGYAAPPPQGYAAPPQQPAPQQHQPSVAATLVKGAVVANVLTPGARPVGVGQALATGMLLNAAKK